SSRASLALAVPCSTCNRSAGRAAAAWIVAPDMSRDAVCANAVPDRVAESNSSARNIDRISKSSRIENCDRQMIYFITVAG
ncbi:hypothetical protein, partial [Streptococcus pneumoniae]|uniref:hypothetical protein n=1 Tax=Streptococcus pneumoniae TaxID=1313 RepID=UPI001C23F916